MNLRTLIAAAFGVAAACSAGTLTVVNPDFSAVPIVCGTGYAYQSFTPGADCNGPSAPQQDLNGDPAIGWTFGSGSGLTGPATAFNPPDFAGLFSQAAFLQGAGASVSQVVNGFVGSETYTASFYLGSRYNNAYDGDQTVIVLLDGNQIGQYALSGFTPFTLITTDIFSATDGAHTLAFEGTASGDHTAFLSGVSISAVASPAPEPATFALIGVGLIAVGGLTRRKRPL